MSLQNYDRAKELIEDSGSGDFEGPKSESLVSKAEAALGVKFPPSYRRFLLEMGCGDFNGVEVYGLILDDFEMSTVPNGIWLTLSERTSMELDPAFVIVGDGGDGDYYALDMKKVDPSGESPIVRLSMDGKQIENVAESFGTYFLNLISPVV